MTVRKPQTPLTRRAEVLDRMLRQLAGEDWPGFIAQANVEPHAAKFLWRKFFDMIQQGEPIPAELRAWVAERGSAATRKPDRAAQIMGMQASGSGKGSRSKQLSGRALDEFLFSVYRRVPPVGEMRVPDAIAFVLDRDKIRLKPEHVQKRYWAPMKDEIDWWWKNYPSDELPGH